MNKSKEPNETRNDIPPTPEEQAGTPQPQADAKVVAPAASPEAQSQEQETTNRLKELEQQVAQYKDLFLRKAADFDNFKRRTENEMSVLVKFANEDLVLAFLPVVDDIERALRSAKEGEIESSLYRGIELILQKIMKVLESNGVKPMQTVGKTFDVNYHDVLLQIQKPDVPPHTVVEEVERGYLMHDKVIRHAKVIIAASDAENTADIRDDQPGVQDSSPSPGAE